ncbi:AraC family transcriptional regulator [Chryseobacterium sp. FH1]|uniref:AraC family transcriptional regulator n=1 Tax=Chryseobacterium sp. FH1 TaxID=1233951 RepID=UPI0004E335BD|nr:helix-turn-helix transcriptional regulator [Chryseobacterium sp. FH1]KFC20348.1 AraC family transcriptional regulator [Chryseobacterium sp. FH1]
MNQQSDHFPILGIQDFSENQNSGGQILFNELHGERSIDSPHKHDFFIINIFEKGKGNHTIDFVSYQIQNCQVHLVFPDQVHQWHIEKGTIGYQLMISRSWFENLLSSLRFSALFYQNHPVVDLSDHLFQSFLYEFRSIQKEMEGQNIFWKMVQKRCEIIGLMISKSVEARFKGYDAIHSNPVISKFLNLIDSNFKVERSVSFYADKLHISANYLNIICKKILNTSASSLIQNRILLEAKRLLKVSKMSVKDIVYDLGFYDHASFSKFFKSNTGMTATQFKEEIF